MKKVLKVYRAERFSPNSVKNDRAIIDAVGDLLEKKGFNVAGVSEYELSANDVSDIYLTMARSDEALTVLNKKEAEGGIVINPTNGIRSCRRSTIDKLMRDNGLPAAPLTGEYGYWLKRGDEAAQSPKDVVFTANDSERNNAMQSFKERGITDVVVTAHVNGDVVKFYGVCGTGFFKTFYADDGNYSKFGDEKLNGKPQHYNFNINKLRNDAERLAAFVGVDVYGGDCIVRHDGTYAIIDFNDWPSFARCRDEAANAITQKVETYCNTDATGDKE